MLKRMLGNWSRDERNKINGNWDIIETLLNALKNQMNNIVASAGKDNSENVAARTNTTINKSYTSVGDRLDKEYAAVQAKFTTKADQSFVDAQFASIVSGSPKGTFTDYAALVAKYPQGAEGPMLVLADGHWYWWDSVTKKWEDGGIYQANAIADKSVTMDKLAFDALQGKKSRNLFNKNNIITNSYINYQTGNVVQPVANYAASRFINVKPSTTYRIDGTYEQFAMYDANGNYVTGLPDRSQMPFTTPANVSRLRLTAKVEELDDVQLVESSVSLPYVPFGNVFDSERIQDSIPAEKLDERLLVTVPSKNLFNKAAITDSTYVQYQNGELHAQPVAGYAVSQFIAIEPSTYYYLSGTHEQLAFYDENMVYVSGLVDQTPMPMLTPENAHYVRLTVKLSELDNVQLEKGSVVTDYESYGNKVPREAIDYLEIPTIPPKSKYEQLTHKLVVAQDGSGDFTALYDAIHSVQDANWNKRYEIYLHEGVYDVVAEMGDDESYLNGRGLIVPSYVDIIGMGRRHMIIVKGELPDSASNERIQRVSTLDYKGKVGLYNLTVTARNMRYPVHPDYGNVYNDIVIENCELIHFGNREGAWIYCHAFAAGIGNNGVAIMRNSRFITHGTSEHTRAWSIHNSNGQTKPCYVEIDNCECINMHGKVAIHFGSLLTGTDDRALVKNTYIRGIIENVDEISGIVKGTEDFTVETFNIATEKTSY